MKSLLLAATLLSTASAAADTPPLGRLFHTPEQRAALDRQRLAGPANTIDNTTPLTLNGRVARSSGRGTVWINGVPVDEKDLPTLGRVPLTPGQTSRGPGEGETTDLLRGGTITIQRHPARP